MTGDASLTRCRKRGPFWTVILTVVPASLLSANCGFASEQQLRALMAKHFLQNYHAIPLHVNGAVESGDVLKFPNEAKALSRRVCYNLPNVSPKALQSTFIQTTAGIAGRVGGTISPQRIAEVEAVVNGRLHQNALISLEPLAREEPSVGINALAAPKNIPECALIGKLLSGSSHDHILVTAVFHGKQNARLTFDLSGSLDASATFRIHEQVQRILGPAPRAQVGLSGSQLTLAYSKSPAPHSLAVQSAVINERRLATIYLLRDAATKYELEKRVEEYLTGRDPSLYLKFRTAIESILLQLGLQQPSSPQELYSSIFSGDGAAPRETTQVPQSHWNFFAILAAAYELIARS